MVRFFSEQIWHAGGMKKLKLFCSGDLEEAAELFLLADKIVSEQPIICEIGVWKGKSSYIFATAIKNRRGSLYSIDPFDGDGDSASKDSYQEQIKQMPVSLLQNFQDTMRKHGLLESVKILPYLSSEARKKFEGNKIDLLFIDGNHDYESVKEDYLLWSDLIVSGGALVLHDVGAKHVDGPRRVMEEFIKGNPQWRDIRIVGEMGVAVRC
jgi:predicted O-methyltransferase YrrM